MNEILLENKTIKELNNIIDKDEKLNQVSKCLAKRLLSKIKNNELNESKYFFKQIV